MSLRRFAQFRRILRASNLGFVFGFLAVIFVLCFATVLIWWKQAPQSQACRTATAGSSRGITALFRPLAATLCSTQELVKNFSPWLPVRDTFVRWNSTIKVRYLKTSSSPYIILGKQDWMFTSGNGALENFRGLNPLSSSELTRLKSFFERQNQELTQRGVKFLVVIAPDKESIYPEYMPDKYGPPADRKQLDQFLAVMKGSPVPILDLRPVLRQAKTEFELVYVRDDTHWNDWGAFAAYRATMARLKHLYPALQTLPLQAFDRQRTVRKVADLPEMMGLDSYPEQEVLLKLRPSPQYFRQTQVGGLKPNFRMEVKTRHAGGEVGRVLVFGDSISANTRYLDFLAQHFQHARWFWLKNYTDLDYEIIREFKPDLVILERIERLVFTLPPEDKKTVKRQKEMP